MKRATMTILAQVIGSNSGSTKLASAGDYGTVRSGTVRSCRQRRANAKITRGKFDASTRRLGESSRLPFVRVSLGPGESEPADLREI